mgnify:FL=1
MILCKVIGKVVCTRKDEKLVGGKLQLVIPVDCDTLKETGKTQVAIDTVGAGEGDIVLVVGGSSARLTPLTKTSPVDSAIIAIIDTIEANGKLTYSTGR